jgi:hypothetical protein
MDTHVNTATIDETGQSDTASVDLTCYAPVVRKDADTFYKRTFHWDIAKAADQTSYEVIQGQSVDIDYTVTVWVTGFTDNDWKVEGEIFVSNPADAPGSMTVEVADAVNGTSAAVDCDGSGGTSLTVAPGAEESCDYSLDLPNADSLTNTATVTFNGIDFEATADVIFGDPTELVDEAVDVSDSYAGYLGTVYYDDVPMPAEFTYTRTVLPEELECGENIIDNTATFTTIDNGITGSADESVTIDVLCGETRLTPTNTECVDFRDFPDAPENNLEYLYYQWDAGFVTNVTPGAMFYWIEVLHSGDGLTVAVDQETLFSKEITALDVKLYDAFCTRVQDVSFTLNDGDADLTATSLADGTYYMQVRYDPKSLIGEPADGSNYDFDFVAFVNGADTIPDSLTLVPKFD